MRISRIAVIALFSSAVLQIEAGAQAGDEKEDNFKRWAEFYKTIRSDLRSKDYRLQLAAVEKFADQDYREAADHLISLIERGRSPVLVMRKAAEVLGGFKNDEVRAEIAEAVRNKPGASRYLLIAYIGQMPADGNDTAVAALKQSKSPATQTIAIDAVAMTPKQEDETVALLIGLLKPEIYHAVRRTAASALGKIESAEAIPALIDLLEDKLLAETARDALLRLTGQDHWTDADGWKGWWKDAAANFQPAPLDEAAFQKRRAELLAKHGDGMGGGGMMAEFYGKKLKGKHILFLLDASGSMEAEGRMDRLKNELILMVDQMAESYSFGFVMFPLNTFPSRGIEPATKRHKDRALRFVERLTPAGGTPLGEAMQFAFEKVVPKENVDTIYLLSDGEPTDLLPDFAQDYILEKNEPLGVTIHTIWLGGEGRDLLEKIAQQNGGQFWEAP